MLRKNKKGSLLDLILIGAILLVASVSLLISFKINGSFNNFVQGNTDLFDSHGVAASSSINGYYTGVLDNSFLFLAVGLGMVVLIFAVLVRIHPVFFVFYLIGWISIVFLSGIYSNIYQEIAANPSLSAEAAQLTISSTVMTWLPLIIGGFGMLLGVLMYKLWKANID